MTIAIIIAVTLLAGWIAWLEFGRDKETIVMYALDNEDCPLTSNYVHDITMLYSNDLIGKEQARRYLGVNVHE